MEENPFSSQAVTFRFCNTDELIESRETDEHGTDTIANNVHVLELQVSQCIVLSVFARDTGKVFAAKLSGSSRECTGSIPQSEP